MAKDLFSIPIFFILFRETIEAAIIVSVLLALAEQLVKPGDSRSTSVTAVQRPTHRFRRPSTVDETASLTTDDDATLSNKRLLRKLRIQIYAGAASGLLIALAIGAAFIAVFYTKVKDLYGQSEDLWEGIFSVIAAIMIWFMALGFLKLDRSKIKWKIKLQKAFEENSSVSERGSRSSKYALFILPCITVLREGLEAVVFLGGVSLGEPGTAIPIAAVCGLAAGLLVGFILYKSSSRLNMSIFLVASTCFLLLIGAGLLSKAVGSFETYKFAKLVGGDLAETGTGPGSYNVHGNVWHLDCCSPEMNRSGGWMIFNAIFGWNNNATIGTILSYILYWLSVVAALIYMKWSEGRLHIFGLRSAAWHRRQDRKNRMSAAESETPAAEDDSKKDSPSEERPQEPVALYELHA